MKVKIKDTIYDSNVEPIMIILNEYDKRNIADMLPDATKYCSYPDDYVGDIKGFIKTKENKRK